MTQEGYRWVWRLFCVLVGTTFSAVAAYQFGHTNFVNMTTGAILSQLIGIIGGSVTYVVGDMLWPALVWLWTLLNEEQSSTNRS